MDENGIRLECLRLAVNIIGDTKEKVATAQQFADFVLNSPAPDRDDEVVRAAIGFARTVARCKPYELTAGELRSLDAMGPPALDGMFMAEDHDAEARRATDDRGLDVLKGTLGIRSQGGG